MIIKALVIWMLIVVAEVLHGVLRVSLLNRRVGDHRARQISWQISMKNGEKRAFLRKWPLSDAIKQLADAI